MCRRIKCPTCARPTIAGCGAHVEQVLADVLPTERCCCQDARVELPKPRPRPEQSTVRLK